MATGNDSVKEGEDDEEKGNKMANGNKNKQEKKAIKMKIKQTFNKGEEKKKKVPICGALE
jgi:hypothetical protein